LFFGASPFLLDLVTLSLVFLGVKMKSLPILFLLSLLFPSVSFASCSPDGVPGYADCGAGSAGPGQTFTTLYNGTPYDVVVGSKVYETGPAGNTGQCSSTYGGGSGHVFIYATSTIYYCTNINSNHYGMIQYSALTSYANCESGAAAFYASCPSGRGVFNCADPLASQCTASTCSDLSAQCDTSCGAHSQVNTFNCADLDGVGTVLTPCTCKTPDVCSDATAACTQQCGGASLVVAFACSAGVVTTPCNCQAGAYPSPVHDTSNDQIIKNQQTQISNDSNTSQAVQQILSSISKTTNDNSTTTNTNLTNIYTSLSNLGTKADTSNTNLVAVTTAVNNVGTKLTTNTSAITANGGKIDATNAAIGNLGTKLDLLHTDLSSGAIGSSGVTGALAQIHTDLTATQSYTGPTEPTFDGTTDSSNPTEWSITDFFARNLVPDAVLSAITSHVTIESASPHLTGTVLNQDLDIDFSRFESWYDWVGNLMYFLCSIEAIILAFKK
jgi:hypothetical protein